MNGRERTQSHNILDIVYVMISLHAWPAYMHMHWEHSLADNSHFGSIHGICVHCI